MTTFADELQTIRMWIRPHVSQSRLAKAAGVDHSYISRLEDGSRKPTREMVDRIATALSATPEERTRLMESAGFTDGLPADVEQFRSYPVEVRRAALEFIERMRGAA